MTDVHQAEIRRLASVEASLRRNYFDSYPSDYLESSWGQNDLKNHLSVRLHEDRTRIVPWLNKLHSINGASILEIGCGTGSSTVALAERAAVVTAIDIDPGSITVARERCSAYELTAAFHVANAAQLPESIRQQSFDVIIFYASLEHMTIAERLRAIELTWQMLPADGLCCVIETPNLLWFSDWHTSQLPFFMWLPDDLAFRYSAFSSRPRFGEIYREQTEEAMLHFLRRGRGVSFHEFEIAIGPAVHQHVAGWLPPRRLNSSLHAALLTFFVENRYRRLLRRVAPAIHEAFRQPRLDFAIRKNH
jgi:S-adenosylmethionine-dependent methyltransferase